MNGTLYSPSPWYAQGFVCEIGDVGPAGDLMRIVDRTGHIVGYGRTRCCSASESTIRLPDQPYGVFSPNGILMGAAPDMYELLKRVAVSDGPLADAAAALIAELCLEPR